MGNYLKKNRLTAGSCKERMADVIGCSPATLRMWEGGQARPHLHFWPAILKLLGSEFSLPIGTQDGAFAWRVSPQASPDRSLRAFQDGLTLH